MGRKARKKRGGTRPGAGRPPTLRDPVMISLRIDRELAETLITLAGEEGLSAYLRRILRRHAAARLGGG